MRSALKAAFTFASVVAASGVVPFADPANASVPDGAPRAVVRTSDLDLSSPAGRATAERRIDAAAYDVCGRDEGLMSPEARCRAEAVTNADRALRDRIAAR